MSDSQDRNPKTKLKRVSVMGVWFGIQGPDRSSPPWTKE